MASNPSANAGDMILGSGRTPGEGNGNPLQFSRLENRMDRGACGLHTVHGVTRVRYDLATKQRQQQQWKVLVTVSAV